MSWLRGPSDSNKESGKGPSEAFLGEKNSYRFDIASATWTIDASTQEQQQQRQLSQQLHESLTRSRDNIHSNNNSSNSSNSNKDRGTDRRGTVEPIPNLLSPLSLSREAIEVEEHGLVLAIQAAHYAHSASPVDYTNRGRRITGDTGVGGDGEAGRGYTVGGHGLGMGLGLGPSRDIIVSGPGYSALDGDDAWGLYIRAGGGSSSTISTAKLSPHVLLIGTNLRHTDIQLDN